MSANVVVRQKCQLNRICNTNLYPWYLDSGPTNHILPSSDIVQDVSKLTDVMLEAANGSDLDAIAFGRASVKIGSFTVS